MPASSSRATLIRSAPGPVRPKQLAPRAPGPGRHGPPVAPVRQRAPQPVDVDLIGSVRALGVQGAPLQDSRERRTTSPSASVPTVGVGRPALS